MEQQQIDALKIENEHLKKKLNLQLDLFEMLIHDLKTPISDIIANLDILSHTIFDESIEFVDAARASCDMLYQMVMSLLTISKFEDGQISMDVNTIHPLSLIKEGAESVESIALTNEVSIAQIIPEEYKNMNIEGDYSFLLRVIQNLLINAIYHSTPGDTIKLGYEVSDKISFFVQDYGPGIPKEFHQKIFDKHFQIDTWRNEKKFSTGLGLAFCKLAIDAHNGKIFVEENDTPGATIKFTIETQNESEME